MSAQNAQNIIWGTKQENNPISNRSENSHKSDFPKTLLTSIHQNFQSFNKLKGVS